MSVLTSSLQIELLSGISVGAGRPVLFDRIVSAGGSIAYDKNTGEITFHQAGQYVVNWCVSTHASIDAGGIAFALITSQSDAYRGNSPNQTGTVIGTAVIRVSSEPVTVSLRNETGAAVYLSPSLPLKATLVAFSQNGENEPGPSAFCFCIAQLVNVLQQLILLYPLSQMLVFTTNFTVVAGTPFMLYASPEARSAGLFILLDEAGQYAAVPIERIAGLYTGNGTVYDPSISYLPPPVPLPQGCDNDLVAAIHNYLPLGSQPTVYLGPIFYASGAVYRNEYGIVVLSDGLGNTPVFLPVNQIASIVTQPPAPGLEDGNGVTIRKVIQ